MEESPNRQCRVSALNVAWLTLAACFAGTSFPRGMSRLQMPPQPHVQGDCNAHHD
jgi:hypothetical protein